MSGKIKVVRLNLPITQSPPWVYKKKREKFFCLTLFVFRNF